ncbi:uncharacterized protein LOC129944352 [Eupeodes corollae]|uniref:uncharacterized protein LOC129944352 n=1 Tax=Eupeodes corollae TaxID=290404 RepID=UPI002493714D|nr:uncharacterized protein LOC129944352 [Eupeodes corollae]
MSKSKEDYCVPNTIFEFDPNLKDYSIVHEIKRCQELYIKRQVLKRQKAIDVKPLYYENMKRRDLVAKYPIYKYAFTFPKIPKAPDLCNHVGKIILDRDILTQSEHIGFLAQPKADFGRMGRGPHGIYQKRLLPNCTTRVESLSHPKSIRVQHNWEDFHNVLSVRQATNLRKTLQKPPLQYTTIEKALTYIHEERRLRNVMKNEAMRKCNKVKKKLLKIERKQMVKIIFALYEVLKESLMNDDVFIEEDEATSSLIRVLENKITEFCDCDDNNSTSHIRQPIKAVARNLASWIKIFTTNCGFGSAGFKSQQETDGTDKGVKCNEMENQEFWLPVEDYISYNSLSSSAEDFVDVEEYVNEDYYGEEEN